MSNSRSASKEKLMQRLKGKVEGTNMLTPPPRTPKIVIPSLALEEESNQIKQYQETVDDCIHRGKVILIHQRLMLNADTKKEGKMDSFKAIIKHLDVMIKNFDGMQDLVSNFLQKNQDSIKNKTSDQFIDLTVISLYLQVYIAILNCLGLMFGTMKLFSGQENDEIESYKSLNDLFNIFLSKKYDVINAILNIQNEMMERVEKDKTKYIHQYNENVYGMLHAHLFNISKLNLYKEFLEKLQQEDKKYLYSQDLIEQAKELGFTIIEDLTKVMVSLEKTEESVSAVSKEVVDEDEKIKSVLRELISFCGRVAASIEETEVRNQKKSGVLKKLKHFFDHYDSVFPIHALFVSREMLVEQTNGLIEKDLIRYTKIIKYIEENLSQVRKDILNKQIEIGQIDYVFRLFPEIKKVLSNKKEFFFSNQDQDELEKLFTKIYSNGNLADKLSSFEALEDKILSVIEELSALKHNDIQSKKKDESAPILTKEIPLEEMQRDKGPTYVLTGDAEKYVLERVGLIDKYIKEIEDQCNIIDTILNSNPEKVISAIEVLNPALTKLKNRQGNLTSLKLQVAAIVIPNGLVKPGDSFANFFNAACRRADELSKLLSDKHCLLKERIVLSNKMRDDQKNKDKMRDDAENKDKKNKDKDKKKETTAHPGLTGRKAGVAILELLNQTEQLISGLNMYQKIAETRLNMIQQSDKLVLPDYLKTIIDFLKQNLPEAGVRIKITGDIINTFFDLNKSTGTADIDFRVESDLGSDISKICADFCSKLNLSKDPHFKGFVRFNYGFSTEAAVQTDVFFTNDYKPLFSFHDVTLTSEGEILGDDEAKRDWAARILRPHKDEQDMKSRLENNPADFFVIIKLLLKGYEMAPEMKFIVKNLSFDSLSEKQKIVRNHKIKELYGRFGNKFLKRLFDLELAEKVLGLKEKTFEDVKAFTSYLENKKLIHEKSVALPYHMMHFGQPLALSQGEQRYAEEVNRPVRNGNKSTL